MALNARFRRIRELHEDDTAVELGLQRAIALVSEVMDAAMADGEITPEERRAVTHGLGIIRERARKSLQYNRTINGLYCCAGAGLDPEGEEARRRLPALRRAEPEDIVA